MPGSANGASASRGASLRVRNVSFVCSPRDAKCPHLVKFRQRLKGSGSPIGSIVGARQPLQRSFAEYHPGVARDLLVCPRGKDEHSAARSSITDRIRRGPIAGVVKAETDDG